MSVPKSHEELQKRIYENFVKMVENFFDGLIDYDSVVDELDELRDDEEVDAHTYKKCEEHWNEAQAEDSFWQEEERKKWSDLRDDSGVY